MRGLKLGDPEKGTLNGHAFVRVRYRMAPQQQPREGYGFVDATAEAGTPINFSGIGTIPSIEDLEAAVQTYRSQGDTARDIAAAGHDEAGMLLIDQRRQLSVTKE